MKHAMNLCDTVEARVRYVLLPCTPRRKPGACFPLDRDAEFDRRHAWNEADRCAHCRRLLSEVRVRINPKTGEPVRSMGAMACLIAAMPADVPPVRFIGGPT